MSTAWLARFITMSGTRQLLGSYTLGSMANAMPQALGAQALDRTHRVIACCGDGGLMMLMGGLRTAVTYRLPATFVVFDNGRLGMVKLEQEQGGLPEFGTVLDNPDLAAVASAMGLHARRVEDPAQLDEAAAWALSLSEPVLLDVVTNPDEVAVPPKPTVSQGWGFAIAKTKEAFESARAAGSPTRVRRAPDHVGSPADRPVSPRRGRPRGPSARDARPPRWPRGRPPAREPPRRPARA
ncbi:thiamine pyrophosphate-dependent enzyme [Arsenicicoccus dermatophilus]|uniref:thiamine pyrophosphate-dependent enzyme n=1 Tax=Arsenicicoccus dermatophilus TaxID=1076331 RepID=UPI001F4CCB7B|nr:thiamine pyrophosphate-dependent enzyme [Arsenicicoccus dermatophilus]MCH8614184.1 thiamine pyrophosphate-dependent enzyme [Arsenicicoccus dermatophilus]